MRIFLRPITEKDSANIVKWRNSEHVRQHCMTKAPITEESNLKFFKENDTIDKIREALSIDCLTNNDDIVKTEQFNLIYQITLTTFL